MHCFNWKKLDHMTSYDALFPPQKKLNHMTSYDALYPDGKKLPVNEISKSAIKRPCFIWKTWSYDQLWYALPWEKLLVNERSKPVTQNALFQLNNLILWLVMMRFTQMKKLILWPVMMRFTQMKKTDLMTSYDQLYPDEKNWSHDQLWCALPRWKKLILWPVMMRFTKMKKTDLLTSYDAPYPDEKNWSYDQLWCALPRKKNSWWIK